MPGTEEHFDAVVVGSGFGGSTTTCRLTEGGLSVCLLERGKPYPPNSFPRAPGDFCRNFWDPSSNLFGLFEIWSFRHMEALVSSGLGGGSLIYANVLIRKDERWFHLDDPQPGEPPTWPIDRATLDPYYDRAEIMLAPQKYPLDQAPYSSTAKTQAFRQAAQGLGLDWYLPDLAITFANPGQPPQTGSRIEEAEPNLHGMERQTCRLCGECDAGCNYGSKNTLDYNYLSVAKRKGATIRTGAKVVGFRPRHQGGFEIEYRQYDFTDAPPTLITITADRLILSAGTFGSTYLLLTNRGAFPGISPRLGRRFSANGDLLTFAALCKDDAGQIRNLRPTCGPVITSTIRMPDALDGGTGRGFYLQDAGFPAFLAWIAESANAPGEVGRAIKFGWNQIVAHFTDRPNSNLDAEFSALVGTGDLSRSTLPLLGMGRDFANGNMSVRTDHRGSQWLEVDWNCLNSADLYDRMIAVSRDVAEKIGGSFVENPDAQFLKRMITVHPLGGCSMGASAEYGVVNPFGEVYGYPGLYVADGSVMPGPVGPNPSFTIAAFAERMAEKILS